MKAIKRVEAVVRLLDCERSYRWPGRTYQDTAFEEGIVYDKYPQYAVFRHDTTPYIAQKAEKEYKTRIVHLPTGWVVAETVPSYARTALAIVGSVAWDVDVERGVFTATLPTGVRTTTISCLRYDIKVEIDADGNRHPWNGVSSR